MILNRTKIIVSSILLLFLISGCTTTTDDGNLSSQSSVSTEPTINYSEVIQKYDGYDLDGYRYYIMNGQKKQPEFLETLTTNFNETIKQNFTTYRYKIDNKNYINLIPFRSQLNVNEETLTMNYFIVNNSDKTIEELLIKGFPHFKNIEIDEKNEIYFSKEDLLYLPPKGVAVFSLTVNAPVKDQDTLKENKVTDLSFDITDLEINGEKVNNEN